jgi:hypothetical protein
MDASHAGIPRGALHRNTHELASGEDVVMETEQTTLHPHQAPHAVTRRAALAGVAAGGLASLLVDIGRKAGLAQATPSAALPESPVHPNMYSLRADGVEISYATSSLTGEPTFSFSYEDEEIEVAATGDEITTMPVTPGAGWPLGTLIAVYVDAAPDAWARTLTLMLPDINLDEGRETPFTTFALLTRHLTSIAGPDLVMGQLQEYELIPLHGMAQAVMF